MKGVPEVTSLYAFVARDEDGTEGLAAFHTGQGWMPMVFADAARAERMLPKARDIANDSGRDVELVKFATRSHLRTIKAKAPRAEPKPPAPSISVGFQTFDEPMVRADPNVVVAQGVLVAGSVIDGQPSVAVFYMIDEVPGLPGIAVTGKQAEDLVTLVADALAVTKRQLS